MTKKELENIVKSPMTDSDFKEVMKIINDDLKVNIVGYSKRVATIDEVSQVAKISWNVFNKCK